MESELKNWIADRIKSRDSLGLNTDNFLATSAFGMHDENDLLFDFFITLKQNKAVIQGEWVAIEDAISFNNYRWDTSKLENLVINIIQNLQKGGRFRLHQNTVKPYYLIQHTSF